MRIVFLGSPPFATPVLEALIASAHRPVAIVTPPDRTTGRRRSRAASPVVALAEEHGIELLRPDSARAPEFQDAVRALEPEATLVASYGELLDQPFLDLSPCYNVHGSLLPRHRGASPVQAAILAGDERTGVTLQRVVLALDAGDVVHALETPIGAEETAAELFERLAVLGGRVAVEGLDLVAAGEDRPVPQDPELVTHCRKLKKDAGHIDWARPTAELERHVRAMNSWPMASTELTGKPLQVLSVRRTEPSEADSECEPRTEPGTVLEAGPRLVVATGDGALELLRVKPAGKQAMEAGAWLRGARLEVGTHFGTVTPRGRD